MFENKEGESFWASFLVATSLLFVVLACEDRENSNEIRATGVAYMTVRAESSTGAGILPAPTPTYRQSTSQETFRDPCHYIAQYASVIEPEIKVIGIYLQELHLLFDQLQYQEGPVSRQWYEHLDIVLTDLKTSSRGILHINPLDAARSIHSELSKAAELLLSASSLIAYGLNNADYDEFGRGIKHVFAAETHFQNATNLLDKECR